MSSFKLEGGDDAAKPEAELPAPPAPVAPAEEFSYFLADEDAPKAPAPQVPAPVAPKPAVPQNQAAPARPAGIAPTRPQAPPNAGAPRPEGGAPPPSNTNAVKALPDLMRPAQRPSTGTPANPTQPAGLNTPAANAVTPVLAEPDAASIAQSSTPSDDFSSGIQNFAASCARFVDLGTDIYTWAARGAVLVLGLGLAVILAGIFLGGAANIAQNPKAADQTNFLMMATKGVTLGTLALAVSMLLLTYDDNRMGAIIAGIGVFFQFGVPLALRALLGATNPLVGPMTIQFFTIGKIVFILGGVKAVFDVAQWLWNLPNKIKARQSVAGAIGFGNPVESKQQKLARQANMFSPCWKLPFCREPIRVLCPAFLAKKTCWKFKRGCYCDTEMVGRIVRNEPIEVIKAANTAQSKMPPPCARCYIFLEHQTHKFRMLSPLVLPSAIAIMFAAWPLYNRLFTGFMSGYLKFFATMSVSTGGVTPDAIKASKEAQAAAAASQMSPEVIAQTASYVMGGLVGFFLLIYLSKFVEWAIFKAKW